MGNGHAFGKPALSVAAGRRGSGGPRCSHHLLHLLITPFRLGEGALERVELLRIVLERRETTREHLHLHGLPGEVEPAPYPEQYHDHGEHRTDAQHLALAARSR